VAVARCKGSDCEPGQAHFTLQSLTVVDGSYAYDGNTENAMHAAIPMRYPYDILTAVCLFIIVVGATILLALN
jgi:hypothetical protein